MTRQKARRDGVTHYSYGEGFIAHLLHRGEGLGRGYEVEERNELSTIRPPSTHYSYGEEQLRFIAIRSWVGENGGTRRPAPHPQKEAISCVFPAIPCPNSVEASSVD